MSLIELKTICKSLGGQQVLDSLDLTIDRGETLVIMGRSGAGKSVILKHIIGLMQPDSGAVLFDSLRIDNLSRHRLNEVRKRFGMLFHLSVEWFKGPRYRAPEVWFFRPGAELSGPVFFRNPDGIDTLQPVTAYTQFDGKLVYRKPNRATELTLGWQISLHKLPNLILSRSMAWEGNLSRSERSQGPGVQLLD